MISSVLDGSSLILQCQIRIWLEAMGDFECENVGEIVVKCGCSEKM